MFQKKVLSSQSLQIIIIVYSIWNIIRYITIGILVSKSNTRNISDVNQYKSSCCDCYYISKNPHQYNISSHTLFDLSYCIPLCTDCNYCESYFNGSAEESFAYSQDSNNSACPINGYIDNHPQIWSWNWNKNTGCPSNISISSLTFFAKSYAAYGWWAIIVTCLYSALLLIMIVQACRMPSISTSLMVYVFIYNILISEICLYLLYKPYQYYRKDIAIGENEYATCEMNSLKNDTVRDMLTALIWISLLITGCHLCYIMYKVIGYCCLCAEAKRNENRGRQQSINIDLNEQIVNGVPYIRLASVRTKGQTIKWVIFGCAVMIAMLFFLGLSIYSTVLMIHAGIQNKGEYDGWKKTVISSVMTLLFVSFVDSPLIWIKIYEKCKKRNEVTAGNSYY